MCCVSVEDPSPWVPPHEACLEVNVLTDYQCEYNDQMYTEHLSWSVLYSGSGQFLFSMNIYFL